MNKLLLATKNPGKIAELRAILASHDVDIVSLADIDSSIPEPEETGTTFEDNAILKAKYYYDRTTIPCIADDSGLEVDALDKRPGVYSARYALGTDNDRCAKVLRELGDAGNRTARFVAVVAYTDGSIVETFRGIVEGAIAFEPAGSNGFGYDPIFIPNGYAQTLAELGAAVKNSISHRAIALRAFTSWYLSA